ncbi:hypothetical protein OO006_11235 [Prosthecochloris sp. SCSIO W1101]|uniref:hypothetical protein n=1 Tax=Prosthecochloris sp. SCSIO W1101 TaxID=2992242 RepID=UPI00223E36B8|nr:hypothetical protein [Prosthecochloris sp. SCSIO W1101]UZJ40916.1 hypothetical protein OO006_11235 [Prosthecochloris sp. SCSIO W1101]
MDPRVALRLPEDDWKRDVMPHSMWHPCGSAKPVMDPLVTFRLHEDDRGRCHAALDAASIVKNRDAHGSPGQARR